MTRTVSRVLSTIAVLGFGATFGVAAQAGTSVARYDGGGTILTRANYDGGGTILTRVNYDGGGTILTRANYDGGGTILTR